MSKNRYKSQIFIEVIGNYVPKLAKLRHGFKGVKKSLKAIGSNPLLDLSSKLSMATQYTEPLRDKLNQALAKPSGLAANLGQSMGAVNTVLNEGNAIGGNVAETYKKMESSALAWAAGTSKGSKLATALASDYLKSSYSMLSAGLTAKQAIAGTSSALILAKGTMGDNATAGNLLATMYNNIGKKGGNVGREMTRLADIVARTQAQFQLANLGQLSEGLKYGIPIAKQYGLTVQQLSASIGQLNTAGLGGSMAGTALGSMMSKMITASKKLDFKIAYDPSGGMNLIKTLSNIKKKYGKLDGLSEEMKTSFKTAFGEEGIRGVTLLTSSLEDLKKGYRGVLRSSGAAAKMAAKMSDTYADSVTRFNNVASVWQTHMGKSTNRIKRFFLDMGAGVLRGLSPLLKTKAGKVMADIAAGAGMATSGLLGVFSTGLQVTSQLALVASAAQNAGGYMKLLKSSAGLLKGAFSFLPTTLKLVGSGLNKLGASILRVLPKMIAWIAKAWSTAAANIAAAWPILAIVAAVGLLVAGVVLVVKNWGKIGPFLKKVFSGVARVFSKIWKGIVKVAKMAFGGLAKFFKGYVNFMMAPFKFMGKLLKNIFTGNISGIKKQFSGLFNSIMNKINKIIGPIKKIGGALASLFGKKPKGSKIVATMAEGVAGDNSLVKATRSQFDKVDKMIPHSNAKEGPFSRLTDAGRAITGTMAKGLQGESSLKETFQRKAGALSLKNITLKHSKENQGGRPIHIHIEKLILEAKDIRSKMALVDMLFKELGLEV